MIDPERLRRLSNSWLSTFKEECGKEFPGDGDEAFCFAMVAMWAHLLDGYETETLINHLNLRLAPHGYKAVKIN